MKGTCDEEGDIVDHVAVCKVFHKFCEGAGGVGAEVAEFGNELIGSFGGDDGGGERGGDIGECVAVTGRELELEVCGMLVKARGEYWAGVRTIESLALGQIGVVGGGEEGVAVASDNAFEVAGMDVEEEAFHGGN